MVIFCQLLCHRLWTDVNCEYWPDTKIRAHTVQTFPSIPGDPLKEPCVRFQWAVDCSHGLGHRLPRRECGIVMKSHINTTTVKTSVFAQSSYCSLPERSVRFFVRLLSSCLTPLPLSLYLCSTPTPPWLWLTLWSANGRSLCPIRRETRGIRSREQMK